MTLLETAPQGPVLTKEEQPYVDPVGKQMGVIPLSPVDVLGGKAAYLSDLKPKVMKVEAFGAVAWPWGGTSCWSPPPWRLRLWPPTPRCVTLPKCVAPPTQCPKA